MTLNKQKVRLDEFFNISLDAHLEPTFTLAKMKRISEVLLLKGKDSDCLTGKGLLSLALPDDLIYEKHNKANDTEPFLRIYNGVIYEGTFDKSIIGSAHNSLIQIINKEYGSEIAAVFIDRVQWITNSWLLMRGFSVGIEDCLIKSQEQKQKIKDIVQKCYLEAEGIKNTTKHEGRREVRIMAALSKAKDIGLKIAKEAIDPSNNFLSTVKSGSKADWFNICQITGLVAQQNILGKRVMPILNNGKRTLPHYPFNDMSVEMEYESRGFIASSFIKGLNPREFYFHAMSGREGCSDTAMNTPVSGYLERRIVKLTEDMKVVNDGTVRDSMGNIYQISYGSDGQDPVSCVKVNGSLEMCDVGRIIDRLNNVQKSRSL